MMVIGTSSGTRQVSNEGTTPVSMPSPTRFTPPLRRLNLTFLRHHVTIGWRQQGGTNHHVVGPKCLPLLQSAAEGEHHMVNLSGVMKQLKKDRDRVQTAPIRIERGT